MIGKDLFGFMIWDVVVKLVCRSLLIIFLVCWIVCFLFIVSVFDSDVNILNCVVRSICIIDVLLSLLLLRIFL